MKFLTYSLLIACLCLCGCGNSTTPEAPDTTSASTENVASSESEEASSEALPSPSAEPSDEASTSVTESEAAASPTEAPSTTRDLSIHLVNASGAEIGMVSYINPATGEQVDVGVLPIGTLLTLDFVWPSEATNFQWALYNADGVLCMECTTDIREAQTAATLILTGESQIESVTAQFE